jgi:hypothetical protein
MSVFFWFVLPEFLVLKITKACVPSLRPLVKMMFNKTSNSAWRGIDETPHRLQTPQKPGAQHNEGASSFATTRQNSRREEEFL